MASSRRLIWGNALLCIPAGISLYGGLRNALRPGYSQDFQWSGAHLTLNHLAPYRQYLIHDPQHLLILTQVPNYLQELYILLLPFGTVSFASAKAIWMVLNCLFTVAIILLLGRLYRLSRGRTLLLALLFLSSTPFRIVLGAGTESLLELFLFCLVFYWSGPVKSGLALGLSYLKYSFSPVLFFYLFFRRRYRALAVSIILPALGVLTMWFLIHGNLTALAVEPFMVSRTGVTDGIGDMMTLFHYLLKPFLPFATIHAMAYAGALLASTGYAFLLSRQGESDFPLDAAVVAVASLMFFTHLSYDFVFLIIPAAACLHGPMNKAKVTALSVIGLIVYGIKIVPLFGDSHSLKTGVAITIFLLLSILLTQLGILSKFQRFGSSEPARRDTVEI